MADFYDTLLDVLKSDNRFFTADGKFLRNAVYEAAMKMDSQLIKLLFDNTETQNRFFTNVEGVNDVKVFDKIGFAWVINNKQFLPDSYTRFKNKVGLVDENGNMLSKTKNVELSFPYKDCVLEGGQTKEDQKRNEIFYNESLAPDEVDRLLEPKVFTGAVRYSSDGESKITDFKENDNLVIKGNNLFVISSLLERYEGAFKLIYLDPPYNTGNDTFSYNDTFTRSTWLTFMKNRLEIAYKLLAKDGAIYVQADYHQVHYLKVLMDEIFGEENFQREIIWRIGWLSGYKTKEDNWIRNHDTILYYSKDPGMVKFHKNYIQKEDFKKIQKEYTKSHPDENSPEQYPIEDVWNANEYDDLNSIAIVSFAGETVSKLLNKDDEVKGQKSEKLLERIISAHTKQGDLILDFFGGSGTTAAVAMKMKRRFVICEQIDKHIDISIRRLQKVIAGEQYGVSKHNNWHGGGSFVYCELAKLNQAFVDEIKVADTEVKLKDVYDRVVKSNYISYKVKVSDIVENIDDYEKLSFGDKKRFLLEILDKNLLYNNYCDIDDEEFNISDTDKKFTNSFYIKG